MREVQENMGTQKEETQIRQEKKGKGPSVGRCGGCGTKKKSEIREVKGPGGESSNDSVTQEYRRSLFYNSMVTRRWFKNAERSEEEARKFRA